MKDRFDKLGIPTSITRTTDQTLSPEERVEKIKNFYGDGKDVIVLSNHINAGGGDGFEIVYALRDNDTLAKSIADEIGSEGQNVRKYYQRRLPSDPAKDYFFVLRDTGNTKANLIEYGFLDSTGDDVDQLKNNWQQYAEAVVRAVTKYVGKPYTPPIAVVDYYVVKKGDSLWSIANKFGISVNELKLLNEMKDNMISIGQQLRVPKSSDIPTEEDFYIVKSGDSLYKIAQKFNTSVDNIMKINNLNNSNLTMGQKLKIKTDDFGNEEQTTHKVIAGDNLWSIARKYNVSVDQIKKANNLINDSLSIGQILLIPEKQKYQIYIVKSGDSLYKIAQKFNTTVNDIKKLNKLTSDMLNINQQLIIP